MHLATDIPEGAFDGLIAGFFVTVAIVIGLLVILANVFVTHRRKRSGGGQRTSANRPGVESRRSVDATRVVCPACGVRTIPDAGRCHWCDRPLGGDR
jgi:hypothetical protein